MNIHVWYHAACYDGFASAWAAKEKLGLGGVTYVPVFYGKPMPETEPGDTVYILDFSYPRAELEKLAETCDVTVLDHHKTAQDALAGLPGLDSGGSLKVLFDMERSGAGIAWDFFHPGSPRPFLISAVEDRDTWKFNLEGSREIHTYLQSFPFDFVAWDQICAELEIPYTRKAIIKAGETLVRFRDSQVKMMCAQAKIVSIGGHLVPSVNATCFWSEVGHELLEAHPDHKFAAIWFLRADGSYQFSFRSRKDFDCSAVAKTFGGGGHSSASGATVERISDVIK